MSNGAIAGQAQIVVTPGIAASLAVSTAASSTAGAAVSVAVTARDGQGNVVTAYSGVVTLTSSDLAAVLPAPYAFAGTEGGTHTFSVTLETAGTRTITATDALGITGASSLSVIAASVNALVVNGFPASTTAGTQGSFAVHAVDAFGNAVTGYSGTVHFTSSDPQATLPANAALTAGAGTFNATLKTAGTQSIAAADTVSAGIAGQQSGISVGAAAVFSLSLTGYPSSATAGAGASVTVTASDAFGNVATSYAGPVHFSSTDPQ